MAEFTPASATIRITNENRRSVCSVNNVSSSVTADTAAAFVSAIEKLYNDGPCSARMSIIFDLVSQD